MNYKEKYGNYTRVPNGMLEILAKIGLSQYEYKILSLIIRKTFGYGKDWDRISYTQFEEFTGIERRHVGRTIKKLSSKNIIRKRKRGKINEYRINHKADTWMVKGTPMGVIAYRGNNILPDLAAETLPREVNTIERNKLINKEDLLKSIGAG